MLRFRNDVRDKKRLCLSFPRLCLGMHSRGLCPDIREILLSDVIEYVHDPLGRRIAKKINGTVAEKYLWQGMTRLLAVYDANDNLIMRFGYADRRMPVTMTANDVSVYYLTYDQVGSLRIVADSSGSVVKKIGYDSFGNIISPDNNPAFEIPFGFAGGLYDRDTGLVRFGYRDYDPDVGRWTAKDPIGFAGGDTDLYGYCLNDPIMLADPLGHKAGEPCEKECAVECTVTCGCQLSACLCFKNDCNNISFLGLYIIIPTPAPYSVRIFKCDHFFEAEEDIKKDYT